MSKSVNINPVMSELDLPLERDLFLRQLIRDLAGTLEDIVGVEEAAGYISIVGQHIGDWINKSYTAAAGVDSFSPEQVAAILVDLKKRILGDFYIIAQDESKIVFGNKKCPFEDKVVGHPSMCMMTSNVFGGITAQHLGYARVELQQTLARGDSGCRVVIHLKPMPESHVMGGREYYRKVV